LNIVGHKRSLVSLWFGWLFIKTASLLNLVLSEQLRNHMRKGFAVNLKQHFKVNCGQSDMFSGNRCFLCARPCGKHRATCADCLNDLVLNASACPKCAKPNSASRTCADCLHRPWASIDSVCAPFQYLYPANRLIQHMKFKQGIDAANSLGRLLGSLSLYSGAPLPDCIIPVPLHSSRLISRGYNQSVEIARPLSKELGIPIDANTCKRNRATVPQTALPAKKRKQNVHNAFSTAERVSYNHVLLIDDVITTGSTINELARTLRLAGVSRVDVLACARAG
jgi:ComF family protein